MNAADVATPEALVTAVFIPPANVPDAPLDGAENVTVTPESGAPDAFVTVATRRAAKALPTAALCGVPEVATIEPGVGGELLTVKL